MKQFNAEVLDLKAMSETRGGKVEFTGTQTIKHTQKQISAPTTECCKKDVKVECDIEVEIEE